MESQKDLGAKGAEQLARRATTSSGGGDVAPLTWDQNTPPQAGLDLDTPEGTEPTPMFETADLGEGFGDSEGERTVIQSATPYDLRPKFTGRGNALQQLQALVDKAFTQKQIAFAVVIGEPGMGKSRIVSELVARVALSKVQRLIGRTPAARFTLPVHLPSVHLALAAESAIPQASGPQHGTLKHTQLETSWPCPIAIVAPCDQNLLGQRRPTTTTRASPGSSV